MPTLTRFALKKRYAGHVGKGLSVWNTVHAFDLARGYIKLVHWLEAILASNPQLTNPYFFCENGTEFSRVEAAAAIGKTLHAAGRLEIDEPRTISVSQYDCLFGEPASYIIVGSNSESRANRLRALGWEPKEKRLFASLVQDEIPVMLEEKTDCKSYAKIAA